MSQSNSMNNYFDAMNNFLNTWLEVFKKTVNGEPGGKKAEKNAEMFSNMMHGFLDKLQEAAKKQQEEMDSMTPEQYQSMVLKSMQEFETAFDSATQQVKEGIKKEEAYVNSDAFLKDYQDNAEKSSAFYNAMLDGITGMVNNYTDAMSKIS